MAADPCGQKDDLVPASWLGEVSPDRDGVPTAFHPGEKKVLMLEIKTQWPRNQASDSLMVPYVCTEESAGSQGNFWDKCLPRELCWRHHFNDVKLKMRRILKID